VTELDDKRAVEMGRRVLANLDEGRQKAHRRAREAAAPVYLAIRRALDQDILAGFPPRGRAGRIARAIPPRDTWEGFRPYSVKQVSRILDMLARSSNSK
jgi:hypothetical protein